MSRKAEVAVIGLVCVAALCVFYTEIIFQNRTFLPFGFPAEVMGSAPPWGFSGTVRINPYHLDAGGSAWQLEPWARLIGLTYRSRALPLWNPHQFFGTPLLGDAQPGALDILRLPPVLTAHGWAWDIYYLFQAALSFALTYGFARHAGFRAAAALTAACAYTFGGFAFIRGNMHYAEIYHLLPGLLWGTDLILSHAWRRGMLLVATGVALSIFVGFPEAAVLVFLYAASYGAFRLVWDGVASRDWRRVLGPAVASAGAWVIGLGLGAPLLAPLLEYVGLSYNIHSANQNLGLISLPLRSLAYIGVPFIAGLPTTSLVPDDLFPVDDYTGSAVLVLAMVGVGCLFRIGKPRPVAMFALLSVVLWGAKLYGVPGIQEFGRLPVLVQTLIYIFAQPLLSFSVALLAAAGVHAITVGRVGFRLLATVAAVFVVYLALAAGLSWMPLLEGGKTHAVMTLGLAAAAGLLALGCVVASRRWSASIAASAACLVVVAELVVLAPRGVYSDRYDTLVEPPFVSWLHQQQASSREPFRVFSDDGLLYPDYASAFGIDDARIVDALYPRRVWDFVHTFLSPTTTDRYVGGWGHPELPTDVLANKWLNFANVRYILRPPDLSPSDATLAQTIIAANYPPTDGQHVAQFVIDSQRREVLVQRTPGDVRYRFTPNGAQPTLTFFVGLDPHAGPTTRVQFVAMLDNNTVFDQILDVSTDSRHHWVPGRIDLTRYIGQEIQLVLQTRSDEATSAPGWGDLQFEPRPDPNQFKQVYAGEVSIWDNTQAAPRAFLVGNVVRAASSTDAIAQMQAPGFDPMTTAVVEGDVSVQSGSAGGGSVTITSYSAQQIQMSVTAQQPSLLVMTDTYYPGWYATIDGAAAPILPTNLAFRGVVVPAGNHQVAFHYAPVSFQLGVGIALIALAALGLAMWRLSIRQH